MKTNTKPTPTTKTPSSTRKNKAAKPMVSSTKRVTFTASEAAEIIGVATSTLRKAVARGEIPTVKIGGHIRIPQKHLMALANGEKVKVAR